MIAVWMPREFQQIYIFKCFKKECLPSLELTIKIVKNRKWRGTAKTLCPEASAGLQSAMNLVTRATKIFKGANIFLGCTGAPDTTR